MNLVDTLMAAGVAEYDITESTDGSVEVASNDGGRIVVAEDAQGGWWDYTAYDADDDDWRAGGGTNLGDVAATVARLAHSGEARQEAQR